MIHKCLFDTTFESTNKKF